jgi:hypothetical protein
LIRYNVLIEDAEEAEEFLEAAEAEEEFLDAAEALLGLKFYTLLIRSNKDQVWKYSCHSTLNLGSDTSKLSGSSSFPLHTGSSITSVIERGQNAQEKSNNWKTLLIAGILRDFFLSFMR